MGHFTQNSSGEIWTVSKYLTKQSVLPNTASLDLSLTVSITFIHLLKTVLFVSFCSFALLEWLTASLGETTNPDLDLVQMFQLPPPPPWPKHPQCFQGAGLLSSRVTKRPPSRRGSVQCMRWGAPRFRDDCMELFTMGDSRSGHQEDWQIRRQ